MENIDLVKFIATTYYLLIQRNEGAGSTGFLCHMLHVGGQKVASKVRPAKRGLLLDCGKLDFSGNLLNL